MSNTRHSESKEKRYKKNERQEKRDSLYNYISRAEPSEKARENFNRPLYGGMMEKYKKVVERRKAESETGGK